MIETENIYQRIKSHGKWMDVEYLVRYSDGSCVYKTKEGYVDEFEVEEYGEEASK